MKVYYNEDLANHIEKNQGRNPIKKYAKDIRLDLEAEAMYYHER